MRVKWRRQKRRQRERLAAIAAAYRKRGRPVPRKHDSFIRSRAVPNRATWDALRELRQAERWQRPVRPEPFKRALELRTTTLFHRMALAASMHWRPEPKPGAGGRTRNTYPSRISSCAARARSLEGSLAALGKEEHRISDPWDPGEPLEVRRAKLQALLAPRRPP